MSLRETVKLISDKSASNREEAFKEALRSLSSAEIVAPVVSVLVMKHGLIGRRRNSLGTGHWKFYFKDGELSYVKED